MFSLRGSKQYFTEDPHYAGYLLGLALFAFLMPLWQTGLSFISLLLGLNALLLAIRDPERSKRASSEKKGRAVPLLLIAFFLLYLIGVLYTDDLSAAGFDLQKKLGFLFFPLLFWAMPLPSKGARDRILSAFVLGCTVAVLLGGFHVVHTLFTEGGGASNYRLYGEGFAFHIHRGYLAIYLLFGLMVLEAVPWIRGRVGWVFAFLFLIGVFMTASRSAVLILPLLAILFTVRNVKGSLFKRIGAMSLILLILGSGFLLFSRNRTRFMGLYEQVQKGYHGIDPKDPSGVEARLLIWSEAAGLFLKHWATGMGTGDEDAALQEVYRKKGWTFLEKKKLNAHSQYLQTGIAVGVLGLLLLLGVFLKGIWEGWRYRPLLLYICTILMVSALFESILERQAGILFTAFFLPLLAFREKKGNQGFQRGGLTSPPPDA